MINKALLAVAAAVTLVALAGCTATGAAVNSAEPAAGTSLADVQKAGKLVVATEGTYRPFNFHKGGSGELTGYDVDVITAVADKLGVSADFKETQFDGIFAGLEAGRFDVIANQISINPQREAVYDFSEPYTVSPGVLIVAETNTDITSFATLSGRSSAQSLTSNWYKVAEDAGATVQSVEGWAQAAELVRQGRVDATVNDELTFLDYQKTEGDTGLKIVADTNEKSKNAFAFRKGSAELVAAVNKALDELRADGTLASISEKYFGKDVSK